MIGAREPPRDVRRFAFDALALAEGEWSMTCKRLGVTKTIDRFATAIGLVTTRSSIGWALTLNLTLALTLHLTLILNLTLTLTP